MNPPNRPATASLALIVLAALLVTGSRSASGAFWIGGSSINWSDPLNWAGSAVPPSGDTIGFVVAHNVPSHIRQDLSGGVLVGGFFSGEGSATLGSTFLIDGNRIDLAVGGRIVFDAGQVGASAIYQAPLRLLGAATLERSTPAFGSSGTQIFHDISGNGSITTIGVPTAWSDHVMLNASYTGTTTVQSGVLRMGGVMPGTFSLFPANTTNQGDYLVMSGATLTGMGTIGLASGGRVTVAGRIIPGSGVGLGLGEDGGVNMTINGDLVFADGARYTSNWLGLFSRLIVNGTVDLRADDVRLSIGGPLNFLSPGTYVVMEYQNRLGSFNFLPGMYITDVIYTSGENGGPGQVLITVVPEPASVATAVAATLLLLRARSVSRERII